MTTRRRAREVALQLLYALEMTQETAAEMLATAWVEDLVTPAARDFSAVLVQGVATHRSEIDVLIRTWSTNWSLDRIALVERNILRLAIYELLFVPEIPPNVTINEAVEIAKKFGTSEAPPFINGILDRIKNEAMPQTEEVPPASPSAS